MSRPVGRPKVYTEQKYGNVAVDRQTLRRLKVISAATDTHITLVAGQAVKMLMDKYQLPDIQGVIEVE